MKTFGIRLWSIFTVLTGAACGLHSAGMEFREGVNGYAGTHDTELRFAAPDNAFGGRISVVVDNAFGDPLGPVHALLRFDNLIGPGLNQVPPGSVLQQATLTLFSTANNADSPNTISLHRIRVPWDESSTWNSMTDGIATDGQEAATAPDATFVPDFPNPGGTNTQVRTLDVTAAMQAWMQGAPNHGWVLLASGGNNYLFDSSESAEPDARPLLSVNFTPPPLLVDGMFYSSEGGASLALDPNGNLVVSGLGNTGQDGFVVQLAGALGWRGDVAPALIPDNSSLEVTAIGELGGQANQLVARGRLAASNGAMTLRAHFAWSGGAELGLEVRDAAGRLLDTRRVPDDGVIDLTPYVPDCCEIIGAYVCRYEQHADSTWVRICWLDCTPFCPETSSMETVERVICLAPIEQPAFVIPLDYARYASVGYEGFVLSTTAMRVHGNDHSGLGQALLQVNQGTLAVGNIGSSGQDGVSLDLEGNLANAGRNVAGFDATLAPMILDPGAEITARAYGDVGGNHGVLLGTASVRNVNGVREFLADFSSVGAGLVRLESYQNGALLGGIEMPGGGVVGTLLDDPNGQTQVPIRCWGSPSGIDPGLLITFPEPVTFSPVNGQPLTGDEFRLLAVGAPGAVDRLSRFEIVAGGMGSFGIMTENVQRAAVLNEVEGWAMSLVPATLAQVGQAIHTRTFEWRDGTPSLLAVETLGIAAGAPQLTVDFSPGAVHGLRLSVLDEVGAELALEAISNGIPFDLGALAPSGCGASPRLDARLVEQGSSAWRLAWTGCPPDNREVIRTFVVSHAPRLSTPTLAAVEHSASGLGGVTLTGTSARLFGNWHDAIGQTRLTGQGNQLRLEPLDAAGPEGVGIQLDGAPLLPLPRSAISSFELAWLPFQATQGTSMRFEVEGTVSQDGAVAGVGPLGSVQWQQINAMPECVADASPLGASGVRVRVLHGGALQAEFIRANGDWLARASAAPTVLGLAPSAHLGVEGPPLQVFHWSAPVVLNLPDGQQVLADRVQIRPDRTGLSLISLSRVALRLEAVPSFAILSERANVSGVEPPPPRTYEAWVQLQWPPNTPMTIAGRDGDPDADGLTNDKEYAYGLNPHALDVAGLPEPVFVEREGRRRFALRLRWPRGAEDLEFRFWGTGSMTPPVHWVPLNVEPIWGDVSDPAPLGVAAVVEVLIPDVVLDARDAPHRFVRVDIGTPPTGPATGESLRIGAYNTQFLPGLAYVDLKSPPGFSRAAMCCDDIVDRATLIAQRILATDFDVIALSEVFLGSAKDDLVAALGERYPHFVRRIRGGGEVDLIEGPLGERLCDLLVLADLPVLFPDTDMAFWEALWDTVHPEADPTVPGVCAVVAVSGGLISGLKQDSGLMLFSRFPFVPLPAEAAPFRLPPGGLTAMTGSAPYFDVAGVVFDDSAGPDRFSTKGAGWVRIQKPDSPYVHNIVFTHLNAGRDRDGVRANQLAQIRDMLLAGLGARLDSEHVWMLGDLNVNGDVTLPETDLPEEEGLDRAEWAARFNTPGEFFSDTLHDMWERQCNLPWLSPAGTGGREFRDRGLTGGIDASGEDDEMPRRLDYLHMNQPANPPLNAPFAVQHLALAYGLKAFGEEVEVAFGSAGRVNLSDHYGLIADINIREPRCQPSTALGNPPAHGALSNMPAHVALEIRRPGGMQWVRFDTPGTYTIPDPPGTHAQVYASTDLSIPIRPLPGETRLLEDFNGSYAGSIFDVPHTPLFVRVRGLDDDFTGPVDLVVRRHQGAGPRDAIGLAPNDQEPRVEVLPPDPMAPLQRWYRLDVEQADSGSPQLLCFFVQPLVGAADYRLAVVGDPSALSLFEASGAGRVEFCLPESGGRRLYLVVTPPAPVAEVQYEVGWSTDLTVLHGYVPAHHSPDCGNNHFEPFIQCREQSDKPDRILGINFQDDDFVRLLIQLVDGNDGTELFTRPEVLLKRSWDSGKSWPRFERPEEDGRFPLVRFLPDEQLVVTLLETEIPGDGLFETARAIGRGEGLGGADDVITGTIDPMPRERFMRCPSEAVRLEDRGPLGGVQARYLFRFHLTHGAPLPYRH